MSNSLVLTEGVNAPFVVMNVFRVVISGSLGGGTLLLEEETEEDVWTAVPDGEALTGSFNLQGVGRTKYRLTLTGSTAPTAKYTIRGNLTN